MRLLLWALEYCGDLFVGHDMVYQFSHLSKQCNSTLVNTNHPFLRLVTKESQAMEKIRDLSMQFQRKSLELKVLTLEHQERIYYVNCQINAFSTMINRLNNSAVLYLMRSCLPFNRDADENRERAKLIQLAMQPIQRQKEDMFKYSNLLSRQQKRAFDNFQLECNMIFYPLERYYNYESALQKRYGIKLTTLPRVEFKEAGWSDESSNFIAEISHRPVTLDIFLEYVPQLTKAWNWNELTGPDVNKIFSFQSKQSEQVKALLDKDHMVACASPMPGILIRVNVLIMTFQGLDQKFEMNRFPFTCKESIQSLLPDVKTLEQSVGYITMQFDVAITDKTVEYHGWKSMDFLMNDGGCIFRTQEDIMLVIRVQ